jgi:hypothetical protein
MFSMCRGDGGWSEFSYSISLQLDHTRLFLFSLFIYANAFAYVRTFTLILSGALCSIFFVDISIDGAHSTGKMPQKICRSTSVGELCSIYFDADSVEYGVYMLHIQVVNFLTAISKSKCGSFNKELAARVVNGDLGALID